MMNPRHQTVSVPSETRTSKSPPQLHLSPPKMIKTSLYSTDIQATSTPLKKLTNSPLLCLKIETTHPGADPTTPIHLTPYYPMKTSKDGKQRVVQERAYKYGTEHDIEVPFRPSG